MELDDDELVKLIRNMKVNLLSETNLASARLCDIFSDALSFSRFCMAMRVLLPSLLLRLLDDFSTIFLVLEIAADGNSLSIDLDIPAIVRRFCRLSLIVPYSFSMNASCLPGKTK